MSGHKTKRIAKLSISLIYFLAGTLSRFLFQAFGGSPSPKLVILYYHGIPHAYRFNFARQLDSLGTARILPAAYKGRLALGQTNVAITFDDAYVSVSENALPELVARGFHSTIFVPAGSLGARPTWAMESGSLDSHEVVMSAEQIATLPSSLVTLGSHTNTHPRLSRINSDDARKEIEGSRYSLQGLTRRSIGTLSFPYGDYDDSTIELCKAAGYDYVFGVTPLPVDPAGPDYVRGRVRVEPFDGRLEFFLKCNGAYAWVSHVSSFKKKLRSIYRRFH